ncbi:YlzJ-like family protein [Alkalihalobacillus sp. 1P02AB]|uniref:YlzJ-like family protein n=1 Tax=Alkalihalobacillus sp. 1P02AB TaxID=3132260 RepID=UPI0039A6642F
MILYTMMPNEMVFPEDEQTYSNYVTVPIEDGHLVVQQINGSDYKVIRLVCSNPMAYLNEQYTPGTVIQAMPQ